MPISLAHLRQFLSILLENFSDKHLWQILWQFFQDSFDKSPEKSFLRPMPSIITSEILLVSPLKSQQFCKCFREFFFLKLFQYFLLEVPPNFLFEFSRKFLLEFLRQIHRNILRFSLGIPSASLFDNFFKK